MIKRQDGFTLIELMIVVSIIGILAAIAIPNFFNYLQKAYICEGYALVSPIRKDIIEYHEHRGIFPKNNAELGLPESIRGKYVETITVHDGSIEIHYNKNAKGVTEVICLILVINKAYPTGPIVWDETRRDPKTETVSQNQSEPSTNQLHTKRKKRHK